MSLVMLAPSTSAKCAEISSGLHPGRSTAILRLALGRRGYLNGMRLYTSTLLKSCLMVTFK